MAPSTPRTARTSRSHRRAAGVLATAALASLVTVTPAFARPDPGEPLPTAGTSKARPDGSVLQHSAPTPAVRSLPAPTTVTLDDDAVEYLQIGLGALGGIALMGAAATAVSASHRRHGHAHPA